MERKKTRQIHVGQVPIGGGAPVTVQSMTNTDTKDVEATVQQILALEKLGCDLSRSAINSLEDAKAIPKIKERTHIPFIADIQFDYKLALYAVEYGCDCLRINPGNIGDLDKVKLVVEACKKAQIPIRVGVNSGSVHKSMIEKYGGVNPKSLVYSALEEVRTIEDLGYDQIKVSIKSSSVPDMVEANRLFSTLSDCPLHLGVTEAGPLLESAIKSSAGIGTLLQEGIGDTIRVSITGDPVDEVRVGRTLLQSLGLRKQTYNLISCPSCARTKVDLIGLVQEAQRRLEGIDTDLTIAIMGCPVNGPGEAKEADIGIACSKGSGLLFKHGKPIRQLAEDQLLDTLIEEVKAMTKENKTQA